MFTTLIAAIALSTAQPQAKLPGPDDYNPTGPVIRFTLESKKSFEITTDPKSSPRTVEHILDLVKRGFYDRQRFHRVESWVTQWGAPQSKNLPMDVKDPKTGKMVTNPVIANGESGKQLPFEESLVDYYRGVVGVASTGLQVGGDSQLFILKGDALRLFRSYAVVGKVTKGMDVVDGIKRGDRITKAQVLAKKK
ncbi:MAG: peptidylprolyl isomerase [Fimbriimonadaceae bacterium]|nr:peptidylprolyl isomerase [Fimbriimonadaceae bacterium]